MPFLEYGKIDEATEKRLKEIIENKSFQKYWKKKRSFDVIVSSIMLFFAAIPLG
jgi:uncharacterized membrane protein (DUF485 family)